MSGETRQVHAHDEDHVHELSGGRCCCKCSRPRAADFKLTCQRIGDVSCCQEGMPFFIYCFYRFVVAGYFLGFLIFFIVYSARGIYGVKFLIYLTNWSYMLVTVYLCTAATNVVINFVLDHRGMDCPQDKFHRRRHQIQWLLFYMSITASVIVTLVYWPILRPMIPEDQKPPLYMDMSIHLFTTIFLLLDLLITKVTFKYLHVLYPSLYLISYALFSIIYWAAGGTDPYKNPYIYPIIDYETEPGIAVASLFAIAVAVFLVHGLLKLLYYLRVRYVDRGVDDSRSEERSPLNPQEQHHRYNTEDL